jgi:ParB-like chromosome segregation protein Spo0J
MNMKRGRHELSNDSKGSPSNSQRGHSRKRTTSKLNVQSEDKEKKNTKKTKNSHSSNQHLLGMVNDSSDARTERSSVELVQGTSHSEQNAVSA